MLLWSCSVPSKSMQNELNTITPSFTNTIIVTLAMPSATNTPTVKPSLTSTPVPTPVSTPVATLIPHQWVPSEPLIEFGGSGGDGGCGYEDSLPAHLTLLSSGEMIIFDWNNELSNYELNSTKLSRQSTCNLLYSIDQAGYFEYDPSTYISDPANWNPPVDGSGRTQISVQAWKSNSIDLYGLWNFIYKSNEIKEDWGCGDCPDLEFPTILPSLRRTYLLLDEFEPNNLESYKYTRLGLWVYAIDEVDDPMMWPVKVCKSFADFLNKYWPG